MARKSQKSPPIVEPNQFGCVWNFSGMFDHHNRHHGRPRRKLLSDDSHGNTRLTGHERSQERMLTFDEQLKSIKIESKNKNTNVKSSSNHTRKNNDKTENTRFIDRIVVLNPNQRVILERPIDVGCQCSYLHPRQSSTRRVSFNDVRKKLKISKKLKKIDTNVSKTGKLSFPKQREPEVFVEARRHLAERLRLVEKGVGAGEPSRTLERILLSSPEHGSMARAGCEPERTRCESSLRKTWTGSSLLDRNECSSGFVEIMNTNDFLLEDSKFLNMDSDPNNIEGSQPLDLSSPKAGCKSENMDNDRFRENPSPISVLESFFTDNICSPTSTIESVELQIQPRRLDFEEQSSETSSPPRQKTTLTSFVENRVLISSYVNDIYQTFRSNLENFDFLSTNYPFESSCDHKLLHDCVKEVLVNLFSHAIFVSSKIQSFSLEKDVINEVVDQVDWHNGQPSGQRTLDHLVRRDIRKCGQWVNVISDGNDIVFEIVDEILQELIMEAVLTFCLT